MGYSAAAQTQPSIRARRTLFHLDPGCLDYRPPLLDLGLVVGAERFWRLLVTRRNIPAKVSEPLAYCRIGQSLHDRSIEPCDDIFGRASWGPQTVPEGNRETRHSHLVHRRH